MATTRLKTQYLEEYLWTNQELRKVCGSLIRAASHTQVRCYWAGEEVHTRVPVAWVAFKDINCVFLMVTFLPT